MIRKVVPAMVEEDLVVEQVAVEQVAVGLGARVGV